MTVYIYACSSEDNGIRCMGKCFDENQAKKEKEDFKAKSKERQLILV